jgi:hypothetical protein
MICGPILARFMEVRGAVTEREVTQASALD